MSDYLNKTEEQQFEDAKSWFKQNGTPILVAVLLVAAATFGWNFWQNKQLETAQITSANYQQIMESYLQNPEKNAPLVERFNSENKGSTYSVFAQLEQAKQLAEKSDFATAKTTLEHAAANTSDSTLQNLIQLRLAALEYQLGQFDAALTTLAKVQGEAWQVRKQVLSGDILLAKGDVTAAQSAYEQAKEKASADEKALLEMRLNSL